MISIAKARSALTTIGSQSIGPIDSPVRKLKKHPPASVSIACGAAISQGACLTLSELLSCTTADNAVDPSSYRIATPECGGKDVTNFAPSRVRNLFRK